MGYTDITVLDISAAAIDRAKKRLGADATKVEWLVSDILDFKPTKTYEVWHDRAVFHFLREQEEVSAYVDMVKQYAENIILATFSPSGPIKCSGLEITQYNHNQMEDTFGSDFSVENYFTADHVTPFNTVQNFSFARMKKK
jgi:trans-aconitate methyltransferase